MRRYVVALMLAVAVACSGKHETESLKALQRVRSGGIEVVLLGRAEALKPGKDTFVLEFRREDGALVDVGTVRASAIMAMAGMGPMIGTLDVRPSDSRGRYDVATELGMAGAWRVTVEWAGPAGNGSVTFPSTVR